MYAHGKGGASTHGLSDLGYFRDGRPGQRVSAAVKRSYRQAKLATKHDDENEEGGCATTESERTRMRRSWGEDAFLPPNKGDARAREPAGDTGEDKRRAEASRREQP